MFNTITISPLELLLDEENPRFVTKGNTILSQESIIKYLIKFEDIKDLAIDINTYGGLTPGERILAIEENGKYIVLEGNRRTTAMKLLLSPELLNSLGDTRYTKNFPLINEVCSENIKKIQIDVLKNREVANFALIRRHIDGIKKWSQISKMYFYRNLIDQGKSLDYLAEISSEKKSEIIKSLKGYSIIRLILDNYQTHFPNSTLLIDQNETEFDTDLIAKRLITFYNTYLKMEFNKKSYNIILPTRIKKEKLIEILVNIAYLTWEKEVLTSRKLNKNADIIKYFTVKIDGDIEQNKLVGLIEEYINNTQTETSNEAESESESEPESENNHETETSNETESESGNESETNHESDSSDEAESEAGNEHETNTEEETEPESESNQNTGRPRKMPEEFDILTKSYPFKNKYISNKRINKTLREMSNINYKDNPIASMFLIRTILETYVNDYIDFFASLERENPLRMTHISSERSKRSGKTLRELIYDNIYNHLKNTIKGHAETYELIHTTFTDNNNTSTMQIIHFYIHSAAMYPDKIEILEAWKKISQIIRSLDTLLFENIGQK